MIRIEITDTTRGMVASIGLLEDHSASNTELASYFITITVDRGDSIGTHRRYLHQFPRSANTVALLRAALNQMQDDDLAYEVTEDGSPSTGREAKVISPALER